MTSTRPSRSASPVGGNAAARTAVLMGVEQDSIDRLRATTYKRVVAFAFDGQPDVPGVTTHRITDSHSMSLAMEKSFRDDGQIGELGDADFIDCTGHDEQREELALLMCRTMGIFGNDVLDALQGPLHIAQNAKLLLNAPEPTFHFGDCPVVAVAAGPSLTQNIDHLRRLNGKVIVVAADSILEKLKAEGVRAQFCTPVERILEVANLFKTNHDETVFLGTPIVHPSVVARFSRHCFVPNHDILYDWACAGKGRYPSGIGTGSMCVMRALGMTRGPVYLVGHDLAFAGARSHAEGVNTVQCYEHRKGFYVPGNAGEDVESCDFWDRLRRDHAMTIGKRDNVFNVAAYDGVGAVIDGTKPAGLPSPDDLPDAPPVSMPLAEPGRYERFQERARRVPRDARKLLERVDQAADSKSISMSNLVRTENCTMFSYVWRSVYAQIFFEGKTGRAAYTRDWFRQASHNIVNTYREVWDVIARA